MTERHCELKQGDQVVMHTCMEHDHPDNFGKIWTCRSDEFQHKGHDYGSIFLDGFSGSFSTEFLQKVEVGPLLAEKEAAIKELQQQRDNIAKASRGVAKENTALRKALEEAIANLKDVRALVIVGRYDDALMRLDRALGEGDNNGV